MCSIPGNNRVRLYTLLGQRVSVLGMRGKGNGQFDVPMAVAIHPANNTLLVGDSDNHRIQVRKVHQITRYQFGGLNTFNKPVNI